MCLYISDCIFLANGRTEVFHEALADLKIIHMSQKSLRGIAQVQAEYFIHVLKIKFESVYSFYWVAQHIKPFIKYCSGLGSVKLSFKEKTVFLFQMNDLPYQHQTLIIEEFEPDVFRLLFAFSFISMNGNFCVLAEKSVHHLSFASSFPV